MIKSRSLSSLVLVISVLFVPPFDLGKPGKPSKDEEYKLPNFY